MIYSRERRKFDRIDRKFRLQFRRCVELPANRPIHEGDLLDIGGGGLRFRSYEDISEDEQLLFILEIPGWKVKGNQWEATENKDDIGILQVLGKILWKRPCGDVPGQQEAGVCFIGILS